MIMTNAVKATDTVILYKSRTQTYMLQPSETNKHLQIQHSDIVGKEYNTKYKSCYILQPYPSIYTDTVKRQTQILFEADMSLILYYLNVKQDTRMIESGTGSGVFTYFISKHLQKGHLYTFERDIDRYNSLKDKFDSNVTVQNADLYTHEFAQDIQNIDAVFLDLPEPWRVIQKCYNLLKPSGKICVFVPNVEQVVQVKNELKKQFDMISMYENVKREYINHENTNIIARNGQYSHTGFLIFAQKMQ